MSNENENEKIIVRFGYSIPDYKIKPIPGQDELFESLAAYKRRIDLEFFIGMALIGACAGLAFSLLFY